MTNIINIHNFFFLSLKESEEVSSFKSFSNTWLVESRDCGAVK